MLYTKIMNGLMLTKEEAVFLSRSRKFGSYADGLEAGKCKIRNIAKRVIFGMEKAILQHDHGELKRLLLQYAGDEVRFIAIFGKTPISRVRAPYFNGSYMDVLTISFPECEWSEKDFIKLKKTRDLIPSEQGRDLLNAQAKALRRTFEYLSVHEGGTFSARHYQELLKNEPESFAAMVLGHIKDDRSFRAVLGGTLLHRKYYAEEILRDPEYSINWLKALAHLLPGCFIDAADVVKKAKRAGIDIEGPKRRSFRG